MAYALHPPPTARHFDLNGAKFMHSSIQRMYIKTPSSYSTTVATGQLPNPKYQQYYDAERDYYVPYNSGDPNDEKEESDGEISNLTYKIYGSDNPDYEPSDDAESEPSDNPSDAPSNAPSIDQSKVSSDKSSDNLSDGSEERPKSQASSCEEDIPSDSSACNCSLCEEAYNEMKRKQTTYNSSKDKQDSNDNSVIDLVDSSDSGYEDDTNDNVREKEVEVSDN